MAIRFLRLVVVVRVPISRRIPHGRLRFSPATRAPRRAKLRLLRPPPRPHTVRVGNEPTPTRHRRTTPAPTGTSRLSCAFLCVFLGILCAFVLSELPEPVEHSPTSRSVANKGLPGRTNTNVLARGENRAERPVLSCLVSKNQLRRTLSGSTQRALVTTARQGASDAAVPVGSCRCRARVGGRIGGCGPGRGVCGTSAGAVQGGRDQ
jgi:hypothetical protein